MKYFIAGTALFGAGFAASLPRANGACSSMGNSTAPEPTSNTIAGFIENAAYSSLANNVATPAGYELAMTNRSCAISSTRYMMYVQMDSYDPSACAEVCSRHSGCDSFNIYVQRDPSVIPGPRCPNPAPIAVTRCALYSEPVMQSECTNLGQHVGPVDVNGDAFQVAIRGSNAYNKLSGVTVTKTVTTTTTMHHHHTHTVSAASLAGRKVITLPNYFSTAQSSSVAVTGHASALSINTVTGPSSASGVVYVTPSGYMVTVTVTSYSTQPAETLTSYAPAPNGAQRLTTWTEVEYITIDDEWWKTRADGPVVFVTAEASPLVNRQATATPSSSASASSSSASISSASSVSVVAVTMTRSASASPSSSTASSSAASSSSLLTLTVNPTLAGSASSSSSTAFPSSSSSVSLSTVIATRSPSTSSSSTASQSSSSSASPSYVYVTVTRSSSAPSSSTALTSLTSSASLSTVTATRSSSASSSSTASPSSTSSNSFRIVGGPSSSSTSASSSAFNSSSAATISATPTRSVATRVPLYITTMTL